MYLGYDDSNVDSSDDGRDARKRDQVGKRISTRLSRVGTVELYSNIAMMFMDVMVFPKTKTYMMKSVNFCQKHGAPYECDYYVKRQTSFPRR